MYMFIDRYIDRYTYISALKESAVDTAQSQYEEKLKWTMGMGAEQVYIHIYAFI